MKQSIKIPQKNNMDLLRLIFALMVVLCHAAVLSGNPKLEVLYCFGNGVLAVRCFFVLSGFLIFMSYENSRTIGSYLEKRIRRIYPAYFAVVMGAAIVGSFLTTFSVAAYVSHGCLRYLMFNLLFLNFWSPSLPGLFDGNLCHAVNGALWTIKIEVSFYLLVPFMSWAMCHWPRISVLGVGYILSLIWSAVFVHLADKTGRLIYSDLAKELPGQLSFFFSGAAVYYYFDIFKKNLLKYFLVGGVFILISLFSNSLILFPVGLASAVMAAAFGKYLGNAGKYGDFSYGMYICHFPIIQTFLTLGLFNRSPWLGFVCALATALLTSLLCWHFVEKPFLKTNSHYRLAELQPEVAG